MLLSYSSNPSKPNNQQRDACDGYDANSTLAIDGDAQGGKA